MKAIIALVVLAMASVANAAGNLKIDVIPNTGAGTYLEFNENNGTITANGNGPFGRFNNIVNLVEKADGSLQGFVMGTYFNLICTQTECVDRGSTSASVKVGQKNGAVTYDGMIQYHFVHALVSDSVVSVTADGSFEATKNKNNVYSGSGAFSKGRFGPFDVRLASSGTLSLRDPRVVVVLLLNTFLDTRP